MDGIEPAALEALKVAREALRRCTTGIQHSHDDFWRVDDGAMDDALAALARIDALLATRTETHHD